MEPSGAFTDVEAEESGDRASLSEQIRLALTDDITTGRLLPGTVLDEGQVAARFGASRTPAREAVRQLAAAGLVEIRRRRGIVVLPVTPERLSELFEVTAEVEAMCARFATNRMTAIERAELDRLHDASAVMVRTGDVEQYDAFNLGFHEAIYRAAHNAFLIEHAVQLRIRLLPFRRTQLRYFDRLERSHREHGELLRAMARGDAEEAARSMREHMLNASSALLRFISGREDSAAEN
jgi:DNA-binding GntR family transcriptional regulator